MLAYRVSPYLDSAPAGDICSPTYLHRPQGRGRLDNPDFYDTWYVSLTEAGAVGETMAHHPEWSTEIFNFKKTPGAKYALHTFYVPDESPILDLDDARNLYDRSLRPSQVVTLNRATTQAWALRIWQERGHGGRLYEGIRWWSRHSSEWPVIALWSGIPELVSTESLEPDHRAVVEAARTLRRRIITKALDEDGEGASN